MTLGDAAHASITTSKALTAGAYFDLSRTPCPDLFANPRFVWDPLRGLERYIRRSIKPEIRGQVSPGASVVGEVYIGDGTRIEPGAVILGPTIIGDGCEIRSHAYIRPFVIVGDDSLVGHASEIKHSILFPECQVPHFAYVGNSILGYRAHLGAGVKISNVKINNEPVRVAVNGTALPTNLEKFGAILGDYVEVGCNTVLNPGTLVGPHTLIVANLSLRGVIPGDHFVKSNNPNDMVPRRANQQFGR